MRTRLLKNVAYFHIKIKAFFFFFYSFFNMEGRQKRYVRFRCKTAQIFVPEVVRMYKFAFICEYYVAFSVKIGYCRNRKRLS